MIKKKKNSHNPGAVKARILALQKGLRALDPTKPFDVAGTSTPAGKIADDLDVELADFTATDTAHEAYEKARLVRDAALPSTLAHLEAVEVGIRAATGSSNPDLVDFGMKPKAAPKQRTLAEKEQSEAKAKATREAHQAPALPAPTAAPQAPPASHTA